MRDVQPNELFTFTITDENGNAIRRKGTPAKKVFAVTYRLGLNWFGFALGQTFWQGFEGQRCPLSKYEMAFPLMKTKPLAASEWENLEAGETKAQARDLDSSEIHWTSSCVCPNTGQPKLRPREILLKQFKKFSVIIPSGQPEIILKERLIKVDGKFK